MRKKSGGGDATELHLPVRITTITPQRNRAGRFSLFHEKQFIAGVSSSTLLNLNLARGVEVTRELLNEILLEEERLRIRETLLRLLGRREHAREELLQKAIRKGFRPDEVEPILDEFEEKKWFDDAGFAEKYASDQVRIRKWGPHKIRVELQRKGISREITDRVLGKLEEDLELKEICVDLACKRKAHFSRVKDPVQRERKIAAWLQGKGFAFDTINEALPDIRDRLNVQEHNS